MAAPPPPPKFDLRETYEDDGGRTWQRVDQGLRYGTGKWKVRLARRTRRNFPALVNPHGPPVAGPMTKHRIYSTRRQDGGAAAAEWLELRIDSLEYFQLNNGRRRNSGWVNATLIASSN